MFFISPLWIMIVGPTMILAMWAHQRIKAAYNKNSRVAVSSGMTGADAARLMLQERGFRVVQSAQQAGQMGQGAIAIERTRGFLSDHYDPTSRVLRLSPNVYGGRSLAAVGVACHEAGHALQHADEYAPLQLRTMMVPLAAFGSWAAFPAIIAGILFKLSGLVMLGIIVFSAIVLFQLITLPVEFDATARAKRSLSDLGVINNRNEAAGVAEVLNAAAWTYVAAAASSIATLLYLVLAFRE
jgi:hypothetical protein